MIASNCLYDIETRCIVPTPQYKFIEIGEAVHPVYLPLRSFEQQSLFGGAYTFGGGKGSRRGSGLSFTTMSFNV
jgi:hypothetical protein